MTEILRKQWNALTWYAMALAGFVGTGIVRVKDMLKAGTPLLVMASVLATALALLYW